MLRFVDDVIGVAANAVDGLDRVAHCTRDAGMGGRVADVVIIRVVELAGEERHRIVAPGTPAAGLQRPVTRVGDFAGLADAGPVGGVVEAGQLVRAVDRRVVNVLMTAEAIVVIHQRFLRDEVPAAGPGE